MVIVNNYLTGRGTISTKDENERRLLKKELTILHDVGARYIFVGGKNDVCSKINTYNEDCTKCVGSIEGKSVILLNSILSNADYGKCYYIEDVIQKHCMGGNLK